MTAHSDNYQEFNFLSLTNSCLQFRANRLHACLFKIIIIGNLRSLHFDLNLTNYYFMPPSLNQDIPSNSPSLTNCHH